MKILSLFFVVFSFLLVAPSAFAKKEVLIPSPIKDAIPLLRCAVCEHAMFQIVRNTLDYITEYQVRHKLQEERLIDRVLDPVCNPMRPGGNWLRGADWEVTDSESNEIFLVGDTLNKKDKNLPTKGNSNNNNNNNLIFEFKLRDASDIPRIQTPIEGQDGESGVVGAMNFRCGARCSTAATACDLIVRGAGSNSDDVSGKISSILSKHFPTLLKVVAKEEQMSRVDPTGSLEHVEDMAIAIEPEQELIKIAQALVVQICKKKTRVSGCLPSSATKKKKGAHIPVSVLHAPALEEMEQKEADVEEMMYRMKYGFKDGGGGNNNKKKKESTNPGRRYGNGGDDDDEALHTGNPGMDVYSRDEMMGLKDALMRGDREKLRDLDPESDELSDEEFQMLMEMHMKESGGRRK